MSTSEQVVIAIVMIVLIIVAGDVFERIMRHIRLLKSEWHCRQALKHTDDAGARADVEEAIRELRAMHKDIWT